MVTTYTERECSDFFTFQNLLEAFITTRPKRLSFSLSHFCRAGNSDRAPFYRTERLEEGYPSSVYCFTEKESGMNVYRFIIASLSYLSAKGWCPSGRFRLKSNCIFMEKDPPRLDYDDEDGVTFWRKAREKCNEKGVDLMIAWDKADLKGLLSKYHQDGVHFRKSLFQGSREYFNPL